ncbi:MAG: glycosyltransferase family 4 protein [Ilumatobacteraceae bacterium]
MTPRVGFVLERSLGHTSHAETLTAHLPAETTIEAAVCQITYEVEGKAAKVPVYRSDWTLRAGILARQGVRRMNRDGHLDALFMHTQVPAVLCPDWMYRIPTVVSLDATPLQYDQLGDLYDHKIGNRWSEKAKWRANRACFRRARHVVTWSQWAMDGVVDGYDIAPDKITVLPPGVDPALWQPDSPGGGGGRTDGMLRILFVGGDLERKGGDVLLAAFEELQTELDPERRWLALDLVTRADVPERPGVRVHGGMSPNSPALVALYHEADMFVLPTRADCLGIALVEAGAAGLPLVSTAMAGIPEIVKKDDTGLVVPPGDRAALVAALRELVEHPELRRRLGASARDLVVRRFDATTNTHRLAEILAAVAAGS